MDRSLHNKGEWDEARERGQVNSKVLCTVSYRTGRNPYVDDPRDIGGGVLHKHGTGIWAREARRVIIGEMKPRHTHARGETAPRRRACVLFVCPVFVKARRIVATFYGVQYS